MKSLKFFQIFLIACMVSTTILGQDPNLPPSGNFDLTYWKITLPDQTEVEENELSNGFESENEFYTDPETGGMVFVCPNDGETGGSTYPRSELREMMRAGNTSISTKGINKNNWVFSSSTVENQQAAGGVDGTMTATVAVDYVSVSGDDSRVGRVIIGQIHASDDEPCRLYYRKLPGNTKGSIYVAHEPTTSSEQWYEMIGSRSSSASDPEDGIALGERFSYIIDVVFNTLTVTIIRDGKEDVVQEIDMTDSGFADDWMYFKAGNYNQNNSGDEGDYAQVSFFELDVTHGSANNEPTVSITSPGSNDTFIERDNITIEAEASDSDGTIEKVEFYQGDTKLGEDTTEPFSFTWENVAEGDYEITAVATDDGGATNTSSAVEIEVNAQSIAFEAPYDIPRFQEFLAECKLQAPTSSTAATPSEIMNGYTSEFFYVADGDKIAFNQSGESMRTELRNETNWNLNDANRSLHGKINIVEQTCDQVTVVQIHDDANAGDGPNKPLLRIYKHLTRDPNNHLWAAIKTDATGDNTEQYDLGEDPDGYFSFDVRLVDGNMIIAIDGDEKVNVDVSFWEFPSYWKAGVYLQDDGVATAQFDELYEGDGNTVNHNPGISITSPANEDTFESGGDITITAEAFDTDGTISLVEFYQGNEKIGEDNTAPYETTWENVPLGDYTITATATDNDGASTNSLGIEISVGVSYSLDVSVTGEGTVSRNPDASSYDENTVVSLFATPESGYLFDGWSGDLSGRQNPMTITMDSDKDVTANFVLAATYTLTTSVVGEGSIEVSPSADSYAEGTVITLTAIPDGDLAFEGWSGDISETDLEVEITISEDMSVTATFGVVSSIGNEYLENEVIIFPNPINNHAIIEYTSTGSDSASLTIHDISGKQVDMLIVANPVPGKQQIQWNVPENLESGIYFIKLQVGELTAHSRVLLNR
ncbi:MAG: polysaccharide lyase family 7 protein [bacterium]|nr:polysaccharide lyase family 7 protein [bacterium]